MLLVCFHNKTAHFEILIKFELLLVYIFSVDGCGNFERDNLVQFVGVLALADSSFGHRPDLVLGQACSVCPQGTSSY